MAEKQSFFGQANKAINNTAGRLGRAVLSKAGNAIAPVIGGIVGGEIGDKVGRAIVNAAKFLGLYLVAQVIYGVVMTIVVTVCLVIFAVFVMFIINSGAYVVPQGIGIGGGGGTITNTEIGACYRLVGNWQESHAGVMRQAVAQMESQPTYIEKLCAGGEIALEYRPDDVTYGGFTRNNGNTVWIGELAVGNVSSAFLTLAHESGHTLAHRTTLDQLYFSSTGLRAELSSSGPKEGLICSYPFDVNPPPPAGDEYFWILDPETSTWSKNTFSIANENFAEMIALYYTGGNNGSSTRTFESCPSGFTFSGTYPNHFGFANNNIFN